MAGEGVHAEQAGVVAVRDDRDQVGGAGQRPGARRRPSARRGRGQRHRRELEVDRPVVVQDQQAAGVAGPARAGLVLHRVLDALPPRQHDPWRRHRLGGVQQPHLARQLARRRDAQVALAAGQPHPDPVPLVAFLQHDHVVGDRGTHQVPPHPEGAPGRVGRGVEQRRTVLGPGAAVVGVGDLVRGGLPGHQVLDPQRVAFRAGEIGRVGKHPAVRADAERAEREERRVPGQLVAVEQDLLAGQRPVLVHRRRGGLPRQRGAPAVQRVLLALDGPGVVPPVPLAGRHRQVGLLGTALDLAEDRLAEPGLARGHRGGVGVLGLQVGDRLRVVLPGQPGVLVHDGVTVVGPFVADPPGGGWHRAGGALAGRGGRRRRHGGVGAVGIGGHARSLGRAAASPVCGRGGGRLALAS